MIIYFVADVFQTHPAGVYRYAYEMALRMHEDERVNLKFVQTGSFLSEDLNLTLRHLFGPNASLYEVVEIFGVATNRSYLSIFRSLYLRLKKRDRKSCNWYLKKLIVLTRLIAKLESFVEMQAKLPALNEDVIFSPYDALGRFLKTKESPLSVHVVHDVLPLLAPDFFVSNKSYMKIFNSLAYRDLVITVSECTKKDLIHYHKRINAESIHVVPIAASERFREVTNEDEIKVVCDKYGIPQNCDYVLIVSTIEPRKNHVRLLKSWTAVYNQLELNNPRLVIAGSRGWGEHYQKELSGLIDDAKSVITTGFVEDDDLPALYSGSVFTVYPSLYEGFGIPILESIMCGRFCLTSNVSSMPEIIGSDVPLVDPYSVDDIANKLLLFANDLDERARLERIVHQRAKSFSWEKTYKHTYELISNRRGVSLKRA